MYYSQTCLIRNTKESCADEKHVTPGSSSNPPKKERTPIM